MPEAKPELPLKESYDIVRSQLAYARRKLLAMHKHCSDQLRYPPEPHWKLQEHLRMDRLWARDALERIELIETQGCADYADRQGAP